jgi:predicted AlkP superfamily pyrophosphatase or phosphodiesterase
LTLYFSDVDHAAHKFGPAPSKGLRKAIRRVDKALGQLLKGLKRLKLEDHVDIIVVSDHGMSATSPKRVILLDQYLDPVVANVVDWNPVLALWPLPEHVDEIFEAIDEAHPHLAVFRRNEIPEHLNFRGHPRIAPIIGIADDGWSISTQTRLRSCPECFSGGTHGYDPSLESMGALFLASGPSFRQGLTVAPFENIHIYALMCRILGLEPAPNDGDLEATKHLLRGAK